MFSTVALEVLKFRQNVALSKWALMLLTLKGKFLNKVKHTC